ncbi:MAG: MmgE/PrpD family protein [Actinomycetota bacterium]
MIVDAAAWISELDIAAIPPRVQEKLRHQILNMLAAAMAGIGSDIGKRLSRAFPVSGGDAWSLPQGRAYSLEEAVALGSSLTMTMDYDDYLVFGHTGHSAITVPLVLGDREDLRLSEALPAMAAANEIAGRLGAAILLGPRNGQMWSYIHLAGGAAAAARVLGLDAGSTAHALALALYQPVLPLYPGFMDGESKVITAAVPTVTGVQAALLARSGLEGNTGIMEGAGGVLDELSFLPLPFFFSGWGKAWVSDTLAFKPYPGCAYLDTTLDAWEKIRGEAESGGRPLRPEDITELVVEASILTMGMDDLARAYRGAGPLAPVNINFSLTTSLALAVLNGRLTPGCLEPSFLAENARAVLELASRVELFHDWGATYELLEAQGRTLDLAAIFGAFSLRELVCLRRRLKEHLPQANLGWRDARKMYAALPLSFKRGLLRMPAHLLGRPFRRQPGAGIDLESVRMEELRLPFPARLTVRLADGTAYSHRCAIPRGAPGGASYLEEVREKWHREASPLLGAERSEEVARLVLEEDPPLRKLLDHLRPG